MNWRNGLLTATFNCLRCNKPHQRKKETAMVRVFRFDGKELFINPDHIMLIELRTGYGGPDSTDVTMTDGKSHSLSATSYDILTGYTSNKNGPGKTGFDVI